jgi:spectrin beta
MILSVVIIFSGYKPCNPQLVSDRMLHLTAAYEELLQLANERRARLEESRKMWQFYWDMADEEAWIKEKEQIMSSPDLGHDLTSIHLLLTKHKAGFSFQVCSISCAIIFLPF